MEQDAPAEPDAYLGLNPKQRRFVDEYLIDLNASQASIRAGYSTKNANVVSARLLAHVGISRAIASRQAERSRDTGITAERVLKELEILAFSDYGHYLDDGEGNLTLAPGAPPGARRAISSVKRRTTTDKDGNVTREVEFKLWDKPGPLKLAGRHVNVAGFFDKVEVTGKDGGPLAVKAVRSSGEKRTRAAQLLELARQRAGGAASPDAADSD